MQPIARFAIPNIRSQSNVPRMNVMVGRDTMPNVPIAMRVGQLATEPLWMPSVHGMGNGPNHATMVAKNDSNGVFGSPKSHVTPMGYCMD